jgi:pimeloyl-ACP methyl ester carboxylesterase
VSLADRLLLRLGARFDDWMIRRWMRSDRLDSSIDPALRAHLDRAHAFYTDPRFVADADTFFAASPAPRGIRERTHRELPGGACVDVTFPSTFEPVYPALRDPYARFTENGVVHARWWRHARGGRHTVLCFHGYASGDFRLDALAFGARTLYRVGLDVVLFTLPFHGRRRPSAARKSGDLFFGPDVARTNEAFAQAVFDARALVRHLQAAGAASVGAFGMSLGGYTAALLATISRELAFAVAMIPVVSLPELVWGEPLHRFRRQEAEAHGLTAARMRELWQVHSPLARRPLVPHERRFVIGALGDRICPPAHAQRLWEHWERPSQHWFPGGHLAQFRRGRALADVRRFLLGPATVAA